MVEGCTVTVQNGTGIQAVADLLFYLEPVLSTESAYAAHPAFSKLFVCGGREQAADTVVFSRRNRDGSDGLFLTLGFDRRYSYAYALRREDVTPYPDGLQNLLRFDTLPFDGGTATPDGCCALRLSTLVPAEGEAQVTLLLSVAATLEESVGNLISVRERGVQPAQPVLLEDSLAGRMARTFLPALLFGTGIPEPIRQARAESRRGQDALWSLGISGDRPILLYDYSMSTTGVPGRNRTPSGPACAVGTSSGSQVWNLISVCWAHRRSNCRRGCVRLTRTRSIHSPSQRSMRRPAGFLGSKGLPKGGRRFFPSRCCISCLRRFQRERTGSTSWGAPIWTDGFMSIG